MTEKPVGNQGVVVVGSPTRVEDGRANEHGPALLPVIHGGASAVTKQPRFAITPAKLREALLYRWKVALAVGLVFAAVGAGVAVLTYKPKYTATAMMRISSNKPRLLPGVHSEENWGNREEGFQKIQAQIIKSRDVLGAVLQKDQIRGLTTIRNSENPQIWLEKELQGGFIPGTDFFRIALSGESPEEVALIVNTVKDVYIDHFVDAAKKQQLERLSWLEQAMVTAEEKRHRKKTELSNLAKTLNTGDSKVLTRKHTLLFDKLENRERELSSVEADISRTNAVLSVQGAALKAMDKETQPAELTAADKEKMPPGLIEEYLDQHPQVQKEKYEINRLEIQIKESRKYFTNDDSPLLRQLTEQLKAAQKNLEKAKSESRPDVVKRIRNAQQREFIKELEDAQKKLKVLKERQDVLKDEVAKLNREADKVGVGSIEVEDRRSEIAEGEAVLKTLRAENERLKIESSNSKETVVWKQDAEVPTVNQASLLKTSSLYSLAGLLLGFLGVSYLEARLHRLHKPAQVHQEIGIQTLGVLPILAPKEGQAYGRPLLTNETLLDIMFTDAVNGLCAGLLCDDRLGQSAVIMVTSASEDEGKTMLATHLAAGLARSGRRTLLVDCDFRKPNCHQQLGLAAGPGLCEVLCGETELESALQIMPESETRILTAGQCNPQVIKALSNGKLAALLARLRKDFDFIIVDSAPTPIVSDGLLIGKLADGVILAIRPRVSKSPAVFAAYEQLAALKIPILGAVVNGDMARPSGRYYK